MEGLSSQNIPKMTEMQRDTEETLLEEEDHQPGPVPRLKGVGTFFEVIFRGPSRRCH